MKLNKHVVAVGLAMMASACTFDFPDSAYAEPEAGEANFSKMVSVGSSLTAGFMNGALYNDGQNASYVAIVAQQMMLAGGGAYNQPSINAPVGCYNPAACAAAGRLYLKYVSGSPKPTPKSPGDPITAYAGVKADLNNFAAYGLSIQLSMAPATGGPIGNPYYNPFFARFAKTPSADGTTGSSMISDAKDALTAGGTFFTFWLGADDVLGYATNGAVDSDPTKPLTDTTTFKGAYTAAFNLILNANATANGVVANIPDITSLPHFTTVPYNPIPLDVANRDALNGGFASFNALMDGISANAALMTNFGLNATDLQARKVAYIAGNNKILIQDEGLTDLGAVFDYLRSVGQIPDDVARAKLVPYQKSRQTTATDLVPLGTSSVLGIPGTFGVNGLSEPLADKYILIPSEITKIQTWVNSFNRHIKNTVNANTARVALVDAKAILASLKTSGASINGSGLSSSITPPFGGFSLDGIHPNARGMAFLANKFIDVINAKWGSTIPLCNPNDFNGNELPVP